jgi:hypothetical protein
LLHALLPPPPAAPDDIAVHQTLVQGPPPRGTFFRTMALLFSVRLHNRVLFRALGAVECLLQITDAMLPASGSSTCRLNVVLGGRPSTATSQAILTNTRRRTAGGPKFRLPPPEELVLALAMAAGFIGQLADNNPELAAPAAEGMCRMCDLKFRIALLKPAVVCFGHCTSALTMCLSRWKLLQLYLPPVVIGLSKGPVLNASVLQPHSRSSTGY